MKAGNKISIHIRIEQFLRKTFGFNELKIEILRNFQMYNIKRNYRFIGFQYEITDSSGIYEIKLPSNMDARITKNEMNKVRSECVIEGNVSYCAPKIMF